MLVAPLWIVFKRTNLINPKGVYLVGRCGWSDYLNLVYDDSLPQDAFDALLAYVARQYHTRLFHFGQVKENTRMYAYLKAMPCQEKTDRTGVCVKLQVPSTEEQYRKMLSRNAYQNIRKSVNHLATDGKTIEYRWDDHPSLELCREMRAVRVRKKRRPKTLREWIGHFRWKVMERLLISFPSYLPFETDRESVFLSSYIDGELAAWFNVGVDRRRHEVVVMAVGTNEKFARYSPGILAMRWFVSQCIADRQITTIDFTRGDERYKYMLGGKDHLIHHVRLRLPIG